MTDQRAASFARQTLPKCPNGIEPIRKIIGDLLITDRLLLGLQLRPQGLAENDDDR